MSAEDRRRWDRQVAALRTVENDDEGSLAWRADMIDSVNERRRRHGRDEMATEGEMHRRARALGLLVDVRNRPG